MSLATGAFALNQEAPPKIVSDDSAAVSTSDASLNRRHTRIAPKNDSTFSPGATKEIEFMLGSSTSFLDMQNMYITGLFENLTKFTKTQILSTSSTVEGCFLASLEKGGIDSLFQTVILENASTGAVIERCESYNAMCASMALAQESSMEGGENGMVEFNHSGIGIGFPKHDCEASREFAYRHALTDFAYMVDATGAFVSDITITGGIKTKAFQPIHASSSLWYAEVGDEIILGEGEAADAGFKAGFDRASVVNVISPSNGGTPTIYLSQAVNFSTLGGGIVLIKVKKMGINQSIGTTIGSLVDQTGLGASDSTRRVRFCWRPKLGFFKRNKYYPLFLHSSGLRLRCVIDSVAARSFVHLNDPAAHVAISPLFSYNLTDLRLNAPVYDFHSSINSQYLDAYKSPKGILFPFKATAYQVHNLDTTGATPSSKSMSIGVRSARNILSRLTTDLLYTQGSTQSRLNPSLSWHPLLKLNKYQYSSGSLVFPQREVLRDTGERFFLENRKHLMIQQNKAMDRFGVAFDGAQTMNMPSGQMMNVSHLDRDIFCYKTGAAPYADSRAGIISAILSREIEGRFAGLDLSVQPLKIDLDFDDEIPVTIGKQRILQSFIEYDSYLHLGEASGVTILN